MFHVRWAPLWETIIFFNYVASGPLAWLFFGVMTFVGRTKMTLLKKQRAMPSPPPSVTILIPAKDEAQRIAGCLQSALDQDYPNFNVIAVDDRSTDGTEKIMDQMAATNPRLSIVHIQPGSLKPGWTGKNNALHTAVQQATGSWLLFVDSDVMLQPNALTKTLSAAVHKEYDLLSLLPRVEAHTVWESMLIPLCSLAAGAMYLIAMNNDNKVNKISFANGQFMLMPRKAYDAIGGHELVKDRLCEDTEMARIMKERGMRPRISWGSDICAVRMYSSLPGIIKGWSRIYYAAKVGQIRHLLMAIQFLLTNTLTCYLAIAYGLYRFYHPHGNGLDSGWLIAGCLHLGIITFFLGCMYSWSKNSVLNAILFFIGGPLLLWTMIKAVIMCKTKKLEWRGTSYSHTMAQNLA
jgi:chlorobactene glucosyltransferase